MGSSEQRAVTQVLADLRAGDPAASERLLPLVYDELRRIAAARMAALPAGQTLQPTALVHEAYLKLVKTDGDPASWDSRAHFFGAAARAMRNILVDAARRKAALTHGGAHDRQALHDDNAPAFDTPRIDIIALDEALTRLESSDPRAHQIVMLRFFAGLTEEQTAAALEISDRTVRREWNYARAWLRREMGDAPEVEAP
ncbi:MAG: ECF-type sigma factor [Planctomycetota bacterium]|nr:ECF-type sigma factor [Planctomycetota bacterium]